MIEAIEGQGSEPQPHDRQPRQSKSTESEETDQGDRQETKDELWRVEKHTCGPRKAADYSCERLAGAKRVGDSIGPQILKGRRRAAIRCLNPSRTAHNLSYVNFARL